MRTCSRALFGQAISNGKGVQHAAWLDSSSVRQRAVRSGGAVHRPAAPPRRTPLPAVESLVAAVNPSPTKGAFSIGGSNRNTNRNRGTRGERSQSPVRYRLAAKASAVQTELRKCPCLARVLGSHRQRSHRGRAGGSAGVAPTVPASFLLECLRYRASARGCASNAAFAVMGHAYCGRTPLRRRGIGRYSTVGWCRTGCG